MPNWSREQLAAYEQRILKRQVSYNKAGGETSGAEPQRIVQDRAMGQEQREESYSGRVSVRITSFRRRLIDPDNLCAKYFTDCLRYAGIIPNDRQEDIALTVEQIKVQSRTDERTELVVEPQPKGEVR